MIVPERSDCAVLGGALWAVPEACRASFRTRLRAARAAGGWRRATLIALIAMASVPFPGVTGNVVRVAAQQENQLRVGVMLGGTSFLGLSAEYLWDRTALEATLGTFSLRDLSLAVAGKQYIGGGAVKAFLGLGMWAISDFGAERTGLALLARAPLGVDWRVSGNHYSGLEVGLNRALLLRRTDPTDTTPPASRIVPLPALYYRFGEPR